MTESPFEMRFDPQTIRHLGLRMYATLPPALAEIVSNAYDADASRVTVKLLEDKGVPVGISVEDDGCGLASSDINDRFLVIGRNRRIADGDKPSLKFGRLPTGKKGLGKLALFGLANTITISTRRNNRLNEFVLDWEDLTAAKGTYRPRAVQVDVSTDQSDGTKILLTRLKRKTGFDAGSLADSLSRIFLLDDKFAVEIENSAGEKFVVNKERKYRHFDREFTWSLESTLLVPADSPYRGIVSGELFTSEKPLSPASGLRGIALFSRGKLVNAPEFFSSSTSSHFFQYLTGWISVDFIDSIQEDVISTNRQSLDWENPEMNALRDFLRGIISQVSTDWRRRRKEKKEKELKTVTGIDTNAWISTMPEDVRENTKQIIEALGGEDALEKYTPIIKALHDIVPEYPSLHWRHLHEKIRQRVRVYYANQQFGDAASQGTQIYLQAIRDLTGRSDDGRQLANEVFSYKDPALPPLQINSLQTDSERNIQEGQAHLSRGLVTGFRNPITHGPIDALVPALFSELDCLNVLSLVSYLMTRLDSVTVNRPTK